MVHGGKDAEETRKGAKKFTFILLQILHEIYTDLCSHTLTLQKKRSALLPLNLPMYSPSFPPILTVLVGRIGFEGARAPRAFSVLT